MIKKLTAIPAIALAAMVFPTSTVQARGENEITRLAHTIQRIGREIRNEFQTHYKRSSAYSHLRTDIDAILMKADHIDRISHDPRTSYRHIMTDLEDLDKLAHHLHDVVDDVERGRYRGWVEDGLEHVHDKMSSLNAAIHGMQLAIRAYSIPVYSNPAPEYDSCPYSRGGSFETPRYVNPGYSYDSRSMYGTRSDCNFGH